MIYLIIVTLILVALSFIYFESKFRKMSKQEIEIDVEYPKSIINPFDFTDLDDFETTVLDILNLAINEEWDFSVGYPGRNNILFITDELSLLIEYEKVDSGDKFNINFLRFEIGEEYDHKYRWIVKKLMSFRFGSISKSHPKLIKNLNRFIHHYVYQDMINLRESSKTNIMEKKSKIDQILISTKRDRRIDDILKK